jgi:hypothetical protein
LTNHGALKMILGRNKRVTQKKGRHPLADLSAQSQILENMK